MPQLSSGNRYRLFLHVAVTVIALLSVALVLNEPFPGKPARLAMQEVDANAYSSPLPVEGKMPSLDGATAWVSSPALKSGDLRGKVVLVEFWTFTCINWRRQYPYVRAWADKYRDKGLVVIGVHTPEFAFEADENNVRREVNRIGVGFPVAIDSRYGTWRAFDNQYWPALYFIDAQGRIRHHLFGEGDYSRSEEVIKQLLREAGSTAIDDDMVSVDAQGPEAPADWDDLRSHENYVGYDRTENFIAPAGSRRDKAYTYAIPGQLRVNQWALSGDWTIVRDAIRSNGSGNRIVYRFHARDLHLVMGPATPNSQVRYRVLINGHAPGSAHGTDVDEQGYGTASSQRMYQLIRQTKPIGDATFEIEFLDPGAEAFSFTFG